MKKNNKYINNRYIKYSLVFEKHSDYAKAGDYFYKKEDVYQLLRRLEKKDRIFFVESSTLEKMTAFSYTIFVGKREVRMNLLMASNDIYVVKLRKINSDINRIGRLLNKSICLSAIVSLLVTSIGPIEEYREKQKEAQIFDPFFDTYMEENKKLSKLERDTIKIFKENNWDDNENYTLEKINPYTKGLLIEDTIADVIPKTYALTQKETVHSFNYLDFYDLDKKQLKKEPLVQYISNYSKEHAHEYFGGKYKKIEDTELMLVVDAIDSYITYMQKIDSLFDIEEFLCKICHTTFIESDFMTFQQYGFLAQTIPGMEGNCVFFSSEDIIEQSFGTKQSYVEIFKYASRHEINHINQSGCPCENKEVLLFGNSLIANNVRSYDNIFFQEWASEVIAQNSNESTILFTYYHENELVHNLEFACSINPNYECGQILRSDIERNPLIFYQSFPFLYDEKEELIDYLEMLKCYDIALDKKVEDISPYAYYAQAKHIEMFYKNLFYLNETTDENLLNYDYYLINIFENAMKKQNKTLDLNIDIDALLEEGYQNLFCNYMQRKYPDAHLEIMKSTYSYTDVELLFNIDKKATYPTFVDEKTISFHGEVLKNLINQSQNGIYAMSKVYIK